MSKKLKTAFKSLSFSLFLDICYNSSCYTSVKFAQGRPIYDKIEELSYSAKSIENDECYHISKNKKKNYEHKNFYWGQSWKFGSKNVVFFSSIVDFLVTGW